MTKSISPRYLQQQLQLDPRSASTQIIALRNVQLGQASNQAFHSIIQTPQSIANARSSIETIRQQFWTLPIEELESRLNGIDLRPYPELATVVDRLKQAAAIRTEFPKLAQRLDGDLGLFHCIRQSITMPPRDVAGMKESVIRSLMSGENIHSYKASAKIVKEEFPLIYAIQAEWFDEILKAKPLNQRQAVQPDFKLGVPGWIVGVFLLLSVLFVRGCVEALR